MRVLQIPECIQPPPVTLSPLHAWSPRAKQVVRGLVTAICLALYSLLFGGILAAVILGLATVFG